MELVWKKEYSVGVDIIDEQHKQFVNIINKLAKAIDEMRPKEVLDQVFGDLERYTIYHFGTEEKYFVEFGYKDTEEHVAAHKIFTERLTELKGRYWRNDFRMSLELLEMMFDWLIKHIQDMDKRYVECFHKNGLE